jgi:hypothetical protein
LKQGLRKLGRIEGRDFRIDDRLSAEGADQARAFARELVRLSPDVILTGSAEALATMRRESSMIPIIFVAVSAPLGPGVCLKPLTAGRQRYRIHQFRDRGWAANGWSCCLGPMASDLGAAQFRTIRCI